MSFLEVMRSKFGRHSQLKIAGFQGHWERLLGTQRDCTGIGQTSRLLAVGLFHDPFDFFVFWWGLMGEFYLKGTIVFSMCLRVCMCWRVGFCWRVGICKRVWYRGK